MKYLLVILLTLIFVGCIRLKPETSLTQLANPQTSAKISAENNVNIITFASSNPGSVNSHLILLKDGIIVIDALRTSSAAKLLAEKIDSLKLPLLAIIITHAHPDHYGGLEYLHKAYPSAPIYSSIETINDLKTDKNGYIRSTKWFIGKDFGSNVPIPTNILNGNLTIAGIEIETEELAHGEAESATLIYLPAAKSLFTGDIICNGMIPYLYEGGSENLLKQLYDIQKKYDGKTFAYSGHGENGLLNDLVKKQIEYLEYFRSEIQKCLLNDNRIDKTERGGISNKMQSKYKNYQAVNPVSPKTTYEGNIEAIEKEILKSKK